MIRIAHCSISGNAAEEVGALLVAAGFEGLEETPDTLKAFVDEDVYLSRNLEHALTGIAELYHFTYTMETLPETNWNEAWESAFHPVEVTGRAIVRASFHEPRPDLPHEIIIDPKMSFGTGHHATTWQMMHHMLDLDFGSKRVLDFGSGTAVLAILAEQLGAASVDAIDNDSWAFENAQENLITNRCSKVRPLIGTLSDLADEQPYDIILANINRVVLTENAHLLRTLLSAGGILLISGVLEEDESIIRQSFTTAGFHITHSTNRDRWLCMECN